MNKPKKNFGQNFLTDQIILGRIIDALSLNKHDEVLEIGCGKGALTERILAKEVNLRGVEIDRDLIEELNLIKLKNRHINPSSIIGFLKIEINKYFNMNKNLSEISLIFNN